MLKCSVCIVSILSKADCMGTCRVPRRKMSPMRTSFGHRTIWPLLSLLALIALAMPQLAWACSMTGKVALTPEKACPCLAADQNRDDAHEAAHHCCDSVPLPAGDTTGHGWNVLTVPATTFSAVPPPILLPVLFVAASPVQFQVPVRNVVASPAPTISPPLVSQHSLLRLSGRAPPF